MLISILPAHETSFSAPSRAQPHLNHQTRETMNNPDTYDAHLYELASGEGMPLPDHRHHPPEPTTAASDCTTD